MLLSSNEGDIAACPRIWLENHLDAILRSEHAITRRSAGIPYLLLGALSDSRAVSRNVCYALERLFESLRPEATTSDETKSHIINSLRVLFIDGKLAVTMKSFLERGFVIAIKGFGEAKYKKPCFYLRSSANRQITAGLFAMQACCSSLL